jgi:uncharacterized protein (TIGR02266 family)
MPGFWAAFIALNDSARMRLADAIKVPVLAPLAEQPAFPRPATVPAPRPAASGAPVGPRPAVDLRTFDRVPLNLRMRFRNLQELREEIATNLSAGGMFVQTDRPPELREVVLVTIELPGDPAPVEAKAQVVHRVTREDGRLTGRRAGVGVQFIGASDDFRERLDAFLARFQEGE